MTRLAFIGGGGFAKEVLELADLAGHEVVGYVGDAQGVLAKPFWGAKETLLERRAGFDAVCIAFGGVDRKGIAARRAVLRWVRDSGLRGQALISPHAVVARGASIGEGAIVAHGVVVSVDARVGDHVILNTGAIVGHDAVIGENVTMAPAAFAGGLAKIGEDTLVGPAATILQGLEVGARVIVGVGASVVRNVADGATVYPLRSKVIG